MILWYKLFLFFVHLKQPKKQNSVSVSFGFLAPPLLDRGPSYPGQVPKPFSFSLLFFEFGRLFILPGLFDLFFFRSLYLVQPLDFFAAAVAGFRPLLAGKGGVGTIVIIVITVLVVMLKSLPAFVAPDHVRRFRPFPFSSLHVQKHVFKIFLKMSTCFRCRGLLWTSSLKLLDWNVELLCFCLLVIKLVFTILT